MDMTFSMILEKTCEYLHCKPLQVVRGGRLLAQADRPEEEDGVCLCDDTRIQQIALYKKSTGGCQSSLYICDTIPAAGELNLFCTVKKGTSLRIAPALLPHAAIAWFPPGISPTQLLTAAQNAVFFYQNWKDAILHMIYEEQGLEAIVAFAYPAFQNPFLIYDSSLKVLAYTKNDGSPDPLWTKTVRQGTVTDLDNAAAQELLLYLEKLDKYSRPFKHRSPDLSDPFFSCNIQVRGKRAGMIALMERNHPVTSGQLELLRMFSYLLTFELQKDALRRENAGLVYHQLILDLMDGAIAGPDPLRSRLTATHWQIERYIRAVWIISGKPFLSEPEWKRVFDLLLCQNLNGRGILLKDSVFFLLSGPGPELEKTTLATLSRFCEKHQLRCGLSDSYTDILDTHRMKNQARLALHLSSQPIAFFSQVRYQNLLNHCLQYPEQREILHPAIPLLARHDREYQTEYLDTLAALLNSLYHQQNAARLLHIHRTTLRYRLQKITELTGICLEDADEMLYLQFSLVLYRRQTPAEPTQAH